VNPKDNPLEGECSYDHSRDCPNDHCVVGAIYNFTSHLQNSGSSLPLIESLSFLVHFINDIHNPMHGYYFTSLSKLFIY